MIHDASNPDRTTGSIGATTLILGCMFSGKTTNLIRRVENYAPQTVLAIKHQIDIRFGQDAIITHGGKALAATPVSTALEIIGLVLESTRVVAIDEAHFFDTDLIEATRSVNRRGVDVVLASLEPDSWGRPFAINDLLRQTATECCVAMATCARCGAAADRTQRLTPIVGGNMVVDPSNYEPRCRNCWRPPPEGEFPRQVHSPP